MPHFYFDVHDTGTTLDDVGVDLPDVAAVRQAAMESLPRIAADEIPKDSDRRHFTVLVTDEDGHSVYSATLTYTGLWLLR